MKNRTSDSKNSDKTAAQDGLGIALSLLGGFFCVSVFLTLMGNKSSNALSAPVNGLVASIGPWAGLVLSAGIAGLGVALFLGEKAMSPGRHALGIAGVGVALAFLVGAVQPELGGGVGGLPVTLLGTVAGRILALLLGLVLLAASAWIARLGAGSSAGSTTVPKPLVPGALVPVTPADADGVSTAEAMALQPQKAVTPAAGSSVAPRDVRLDGGVPVGTSALPSSGEFDAVVEEQDLTETRVQGIDPSSFAFAETEESVAAEPVEYEDAVDEFLDEPAEELPEEVEEELPPSPVAASSWESSDEPEEEEFEDDLEEPSAEAEEGELGEEEDEEEYEDEEDELEEVYAEDEAGELEEDEEEADEEYEEEEEDEAAELEEDEEDELEEDEAAELEEDEAAELEEDEAAELEEDEEDEEDEEEYEDEEVLMEAEVEAPSAVLPEPAAEPASAESDALPAEPSQAGLFDAPDAEPEVVLTPRAAPGKSPGKSTDAKKPRKTAKKSRGKQAQAGGATDSSLDLSSDLIVQAGELILEHNRVAVSMLQRQFDLDFDKACLVLDKLQDVGLIGPYVGGRNRDILLTEEAWHAMAAEVASS